MKISKKIKEAAKGIFASNTKVDTIYVNQKGEFFTRENFARMSGTKYTPIQRGAILDLEEDQKPGTLPAYDDITKNEIIEKLEELEVDLENKASAYEKKELYEVLKGALEITK